MAEHEQYADRRPIEAAYVAVADATDTDPLDLPPIADTVDPAAVDDVVESAGDRTEVRLKFDYAGCTVTLTADAVTVDGPETGD